MDEEQLGDEKVDTANPLKVSGWLPENAKMRKVENEMRYRA